MHADSAMNRPRIAISCGDLHGVGIEIAIAMHAHITSLVEPIYMISQSMANQAASKLNTTLPESFTTCTVEAQEFTIEPGTLNTKSAQYGFQSFLQAVKLAQSSAVDGICTLPINKEAWMQAGIHYSGHTDYLRAHFKQDAIMMLGSSQLNVALFTEHIPFNEVAAAIDSDKLTQFLIDFYQSVACERCAVLALNPHAGDGGLLGHDEEKINTAIQAANATLQRDVFQGPMVPDTAFTPSMRQTYRYYVAMYHDQGLIPLKALYFDESINVSLNLPIIRTSVDHGTAFDIAYQGIANTTSYLQAIKAAATLVQSR